MPWGHTRYIARFENEATGVFTTFPTRQMAIEDNQEFRRADRVAIGADYAYPFNRGGSLAREVANVSARGMLVGAPASIDSQMDTLMLMHVAGMGKLWSKSAGDADDRWCWAILSSKPKSAFGATVRGYLEVQLEFLRYSDWFAATQETNTTLINANPKTYNVTVGGQLPIRQGNELTLTLTGPWSNPVTILNQTNGKSVTLAAAGANSSARWRLVQDQIVSETSTNSGSSYSDAYANTTTPAGQIGFMELEPGANSMRVSGAPSAGNLVIAYWPGYLNG